MRDAFGRLLIDPGELGLRERVDVLRRLAGELQAARSRDAQWLGARLTAWLTAGGDLADVLGVRPPRGSRTTPQALLRNERRDRLVVRLAIGAGSDRAALRILQGIAPCPPSLRAALAELQGLGAPRSLAAFSRARERFAR